MTVKSEIEAALGELTAAMVHDHPIRMKGEQSGLRTPAVVATMRELVKRAKAGDELAALIPALSGSVDPDLRQDVLRQMEATDPDGSAELLVQAVERDPRAAHYNDRLATPIGALCLAVSEGYSYAAAVKLRAALLQRKKRLVAVAKAVEHKGDKKLLDEGLASLGMDAGDIDKACAALRAGKATPLGKLMKALDARSEDLLRVIPDLEAFAVKVQATRKREYGDALYVLESLSLHADVSPAVFVYALRHYQGQNEEESALTGIKRLATRYVQTGRRAALDALRSALRDGGGEPAVLAKHFDSLG